MFHCCIWSAKQELLRPKCHVVPRQVRRVAHVHVLGVDVAPRSGQIAGVRALALILASLR